MKSRRERDARYNHSEKGRARYLRYVHRRRYDPTIVPLTRTTLGGRVEHVETTKGRLFMLYENIDAQRRRRQVALQRQDAEMAALVAMQKARREEWEYKREQAAIERAKRPVLLHFTATRIEGQKPAG